MYLIWSLFGVDTIIYDTSQDLLLAAEHFFLIMKNHWVGGNYFLLKQKKFIKRKIYINSNQVTKLFFISI